MFKLSGSTLTMLFTFFASFFLRGTAFRWKNEDYSCYNSISSLSINGTVTDTSDTTLVSHHFTHNFEENWFATTFAEGSGWSNPQTSNFGDSFDTENVNPTNTYWRIKIL